MLSMPCPYCGRYVDDYCAPCNWQRGVSMDGPTFMVDYHVGYRTWLLVGSSPHTLTSLLSIGNVPCVWEPGFRMVAACPKGSPVAPCGPAPCGDTGKGCGIYAVKRPELLDVGANPGVVCARVALWGRVWEHKAGAHMGYRAQYAYPLAFLAPPVEWRGNSNMDGWEARLEALGAAWGVQVVDGG